MSSGNGHAAVLTFTRPPRRVVSLVPSMTESLFELGAGGSLVGVTDYCHLPAGSESIPRLGGTKSPRLEEIVRLAPELVIANQEENTPEAVRRLEAGGVKVWVTFPRTVDDAVAILWVLIRLFHLQPAGARVKTIEVALEWTSRAAATRTPARVFCPIWKGEREVGHVWWMTFNARTYAHDLLARCGGANVFAERNRRYPLAAEFGEVEAEDPQGKDVRYPRVAAEEIRAADPEVILLPSEPFAFGEAERERIRSELAGTAAVRSGRVHLVDGSLITWHGTRLARALVELPPLLEAVAAT